jgi:hypothetical protein
MSFAAPRRFFGKLCWMAALLAWLHAGRVGAQTGYSGTVVRGMFGPRVLGEPLRPKPSQFGGGIVRGPSGELYGVGRAEGGLFSGNRRPNADRLNQTVPAPPAWLRDSAVAAGVADAYRRPPEPISVQDTTLRQPSEAAEPPWLDSVDDSAPMPTEATPAESMPTEAAPTEPIAPASRQPLPPRKPEPQKPVPEPGTQPGTQPGDQWLRAPKPLAATLGAARPAPAMEVPSGVSQSNVPPARVRAATGVVISSPSESRFGVPAESPSVAVESLLRGNPRSAKPAEVRASIEGDVLVLRGRVATGHDRAVAEAAARMEPGVEKVRNELTVEPSATALR